MITVIPLVFIRQWGRSFFYSHLQYAGLLLVMVLHLSSVLVLTDIISKTRTVNKEYRQKLQRFYRTYQERRKRGSTNPLLLIDSHIIWRQKKLFTGKLTNVHTWLQRSFQSKKCKRIITNALICNCIWTSLRSEISSKCAGKHRRLAKEKERL